jgi:CheY-like chemotaxis protein
MSDVTTVLVVSDLAALRNDIRSSIESPSILIEDASSGPQALARVRQGGIDLVIADMQVASMGAVALVTEIHNDESLGLIEPVAVIVLLDRRADVFLARRINVEGFLVKPLDALRIRHAVRAVINGDGYEDDTLRPATVTIAE